MSAHFIKNQEGNVSIFGALLALPILMMIVVTFDYTRISTVRGEMQSSLDHASVSPLMMMSDMPGAEKNLENFINANSGRETADVNISIFQDKLRVEATDTIDTPLLSVIGRPVSTIVVRLEMDVPQSNNSVRLTSLDRGGVKVGQNKAYQERQQIAALKRFERSLERSIKRISARNSLPRDYKRRLVRKLNKQLREVRREIRNTKVR